ncbi:NeuD/PglB/VioB family sugar acetyltransferase [Flavobacterium sp.]|uniref:NeuD/PglB/VioB family sugar acetyltransferase n=1 Tax=Flavobacterium sp. TaxID=239 RepID=UPI00286E1172|nr:NeuD/PglB/VioB family sugar acetyltransferase [Flavobacterium sp.]
MEDTQYNNRKIIIIGAGGLARELESWISSDQETKESCNIIGYLNDDLELKHVGLLHPIINKIDFSIISNENFFLVGIADCVFKEKLSIEAKKYGIKFESYIHNTSLIGSRTTLGTGIVMLPYSIVSCDAIIGDLVFINNGSQIGHDVIIGDYCSIMANVDIGGGAQIGKNVLIGSNAVILPGVKIPENTVVGAGSVVVKSIKQSGSYFGNPAKKIF